MTLLGILIIGVTTISEGKYVEDTMATVANIFIDRNPPQIQCVSIQNTNTGYEKFANHTHTITVQIKAIEKHMKENRLETEKVKAFINEKEISSNQIAMKKIKEVGDSIFYEIILKELEGDGPLTIKIRKGILIDTSENMNQEQVINTNIQIDNTPPNANFKEEEIENGKVMVRVNANEAIRNKEGWKPSEDRTEISKEFTTKIKYKMPIIDLAQNKSKVEIKVSKATNIIFSYGTFSQGTQWEFTDGSQPIAGKKAVQQNINHKTEMTAFHTSGEIADDFIQIQNYIHTYWGEGAIVLGIGYETYFKHGYNPSPNSYHSMKNGEKLKLNGKTHILFGGDEVNRKNKTDTITRKPIPEEIAKQFLFGMSGLRFKLKEESYYSIIYQILLEKHGWQRAVADGEEAVYSHDKPMTAFRVVLAPKTEKQDIIENWNQDIGTFQIE